MDSLPSYQKEHRKTLMSILEEAGKNARSKILSTREGRKGEQISGTGHHTGTTLSSSAPGIVQGEIIQSAIGKYNMDNVDIVFESSNFEHNFTGNKPLLLIDEIDGQKSTGRFQSQRTGLEARLQTQGWDALNMRPDSAICMALFEGPSFNDIVLNVTSTMQGDVYSAIKYSEGSEAKINGVTVQASDFQSPNLQLSDCQIDIMGNTNYNLGGIGLLAEKLITQHNYGKYGEVRITSSGSSTIDMVNMIAGKMDAIVDLRALYDDSWASLELADIASMYRFLKAVGFYISDVYGNDLEDHHFDDNKLKNERITLVVARTKELGESIVKDLSPHIEDSIKEWDRKKYTMRMPSDPEYKIVEPMAHSNYKSSYIGRNVHSGQLRFVHIIDLSPEGQKFLEDANIPFEEYLQNECRVAMLAEEKHPNIIEMETPVVLEDGRIALREPVYEKVLTDIYKAGETAPSPETFYDHAMQMLEGLEFCHEHSEGPIIHGDIKLDNMGLIKEVLKLDDFGVSSKVKEINVPEFRGKNVGSIDTKAPELFEEGSHKSTQSDVYSAGATMVRMLTGYYPHPEYEKDKPKNTDESRTDYENSIQKFRVETSPDEYEKALQERMRSIPEELRDLLMSMMERNPRKRPKNATEAKESLQNIVERHEAYNSIKKTVLDNVKKTNGDLYLDHHLQDTETKLLEIDPGASYAERTAAILHDYERIRSNRVKKRESESYNDYKRRHAKAAADYAKDLCKENGADTKFTDDVWLLVRYHDQFSLPRDHTSMHRKIEQLRDADSLSFFDITLPQYISNHPGDEERIGKKVEFMFRKMSENGRKFLEEERFHGAQNMMDQYMPKITVS